MVLFMRVGVYSDRQCWVSLEDQIPTGRGVHIFFKCVCEYTHVCEIRWLLQSLLGFVGQVGGPVAWI